MDGTILSQGSFLANTSGLANPNPGVASISQANPTYLNIPSNVDWLWVRNYTKKGAVGAAAGAYFNGTANANVGYDFIWQRGMAAGTGEVGYKAAATSVRSDDTYVSGGFTLYDPSGQSVGSLPLIGLAVATTASTNATRPVVSTADTSGMSVGSVVRLNSTAQTDVNGVDFVVGAVTANTSFTLLTASNPLANAPGAIGGAGFYRLVNVDPLYYPRMRYVVNVTQAVNPVVGTSVAHGLTPGQQLRFSVPVLSSGAAGMSQLNGREATVLSVIDDYTFTINLDTSAFTAFVWPTIAQSPSGYPHLVPFGENTAEALVNVGSQVPTIGGLKINATQTGILADATTNTGFLGMVLGSGGVGNVLATPIIGPSGSISWSAGDVASPDRLYWIAGKSSFGGL